MERLFAAHKRHGSIAIDALRELPPDLMQPLGGSCLKRVHPERWAFLDTETTGLLGAPESYAFLIGVGRITSDGFRVRQFFTRNYAEEPSALAAVCRHLSDFDLVITFNGKTYDEPLLNKRYRSRGQDSPFERLGHFDVLHGARRVWKLRLRNCKLTQLEREVLGFHRQGDLASELIPCVYFEYLRSQKAERLIPVFHHNAMDILTLACLLPIVPRVFQNPQVEALHDMGIHRGEDLFGVAMWLVSQKRFEEALSMFTRAAEAAVSDKLLFRVLWQIAIVRKKLREFAAATDVLIELSACQNEYRLRAMEELAKHFERRVGDYARALELTKALTELVPSEQLSRREARLLKRLSSKQKKRVSKAALTPL
jgi:uncharacterized protein YprB with RNaseH-like and TPR domain